MWRCETSNWKHNKRTKYHEKRKYRFEKETSKLWELITVVINFNGLHTAKETVHWKRDLILIQSVSQRHTHEIVIKDMENRMRKNKFQKKKIHNRELFKEKKA